MKYCKNGFQLLPIITKHSILDVAAALDPSLELTTDQKQKVTEHDGKAENMPFVKRRLLFDYGLLVRLQITKAATGGVL